MKNDSMHQMNTDSNDNLSTIICVTMNVIYSNDSMIILLHDLPRVYQYN